MPEPQSTGHLNPGDAEVAFDRFELGAGLEQLVRHVWVARWNVPAGEVRPQRVLGYPAFNAILRPGEATLAGPDPRLFVEELRGASWVVGVLFRPAAGRLLSATPPVELVGAAEPLPGAPLVGVTRAMGEAVEEAGAAASVASAASARDVAGAAAPARRALVLALRAWLLPIATDVGADGVLVNRVCAAAENDPGILRAAELAERFGLSTRSLERLVRARVGVTPKWLIECRRLQQASTTLFAHPETELSALAAELGYADYAHFSRRFAQFLGQTPRSARRTE
ncbi:helix-turn-helix domain-containing protein [Herbiconiux sp. 11R-BC]|uniref:AraC family transcriptional regulator n=1 Tax=Herbiconiux sp. 11R-BC TaxID=3111637 RepID=UPI003BFDA438